MKTKSNQIMERLMKSNSNIRQVVLDRTTDEYVEVTSKCRVNVGKGKIGQVVRFKDGTAIRVTYEIVE